MPISQMLKGHNRRRWQKDYEPSESREDLSDRVSFGLDRIATLKLIALMVIYIRLAQHQANQHSCIDKEGTYESLPLAEEIQAVLEKDN